MSQVLATAFNSARLGFVPVRLANVPASALAGLTVHLKTTEDDVANSQAEFILYRDPSFPFTEDDRQRLLQHGVKCVYVALVGSGNAAGALDQVLVDLAGRPECTTEAIALVYGTTTELVDELLSGGHLEQIEPRLGTISRAVAQMVVRDEHVFSQLFEVAQHDFYTATHVVNVATWMVPLACACGIRDQSELAIVFRAGLLHDIGKTLTPAEILNKPGQLSDQEWEILRRHPQDGYEQLRRFGETNEIVLRVTHEHHERLDGSGYPRGLRAGEIHPLAAVCAVIDTFEAMTALRPHRRFAHPVEHAIATLKQGAGTKYDAGIVDAWLRLLRGVVRPAGSSVPATDNSAALASVKAAEQRQFPRHPLRAAASVALVEAAGSGPTPCLLRAVTRDVSRNGLGLLSRQPLKVGEPARVRLDARGWEGRELIGHVARCAPLKDGWYDIGIAFGPSK